MTNPDEQVHTLTAAPTSGTPGDDQPIRTYLVPSFRDEPYGRAERVVASSAEAAGHWDERVWTRGVFSQ
jgi:hypothetical protein